MNAGVLVMKEGSVVKQPHVMVVDDERLILKNLEILLKGKGCCVSAVSSATEALREIAANPPDAILLDVVMPGIDGYELCRRLKSDPALRHIPVILITALNDVFSKVRGLDAGADDFVSKPFNEAELRARLWAHLRNKSLHDQLDANYRGLQELEQMKEALTHMIIHDVSSPLTAVSFGLESAIERLDEKQPLTERHEKMLRSSLEGCRRVMDMLRDVLVVQRLEEQKFPLQCTVVDCGALIAGCLSLLEPIRNVSGVAISTVVESGPLAISVDSELLSRVMTNLVSNALKFTPRGGAVQIVFRKVDKNEFEGCVSDNGAGIPPGYIDRIFDRFVQAQGSSMRNGLGLGLAFCRLAVEAHGGRIWAEHNNPKGSRFVFRLPIHRD